MKLDAASSVGIDPEILKQLKVKGSGKAKYGNRRFTADGERWDSRKEYHYWLLMKVTNASGRIQNLRRQVRYDLVVNNVLVCYYKADFVYEEDGKTVVVDVKSMITRKLPVYRIKKKLMLALHNIWIREV